MTFRQFVTAVFFTAQMLAAGAASADCVLPKSPSATPNGASASAAEMEAARVSLERYQKAVKDYIACTDQEAKGRIAELGTNVEAIRQVKLMADKRSKGLQEELQTRADELNDQLRAFKLNNRE
jgi:hypothetical protein